MLNCRWFLVIIACFYLLPAIASAEEYRIASGDVLSLRVLEWQPTESRAQVWDAFTVELLVDADGSITIPFLGPTPAAGHSTEELATEISRALRQRLAVSTSLDAVVQIASYRPVYVTGAVRIPGEYAFRPGLTATQLIARAGGSAFARDTAEINLSELLSREGTMRLLALESERLAIRRAMLQAAIGGADRLEEPRRQGGGPWSADLVKSENEVLRLRQVRRKRELASLDSQIRLYNNEIESLIERTAAQELLVESARDERQTARSLAQRGLAVGSRVAETERSLVLIEGQLLDLSTAILRARQAITLAEAEKSALRDRELIEDTRELQRVEEELERILANLATEEEIAHLEIGRALGDGLGEGDRPSTDMIVTIVRDQSGVAVPLSGPEAVLAPGDVVRVAIPRNWGRRPGETLGLVTQ
tara:strand:- start:1290 stop:2552 length:1263 start_codon:yes stop_codon:yes gene_type:complete